MEEASPLALSEGSELVSSSPLPSGAASFLKEAKEVEKARPFKNARPS
jgi:hypothetical protein